MSHTIGVDVGGTKVLGVLTTSEGEVVGEERLPTPAGGEAILDAVASVIDKVRAGSDTALVGVGMPGLVDNDGVLRFAPNLPGVLELPVRAGIEQRVAGMTVRVENDATCAVWGERVLGAAKGPRCPTCEERMAKVDDVVEEAIEEALNQDCRVEMCEGNADLDVLGRIGALLRF